MNSKVIIIIVLLLVILALLYKMMNSMKLQSELTIGIAKKAGVPIPAQKQKLSLSDLLKPTAKNAEEEETEDAEYEEQEEIQEEESGEEETDEEREEREEAARQAENNKGELDEVDEDNQSQALEFTSEEKKPITNHLKVVKTKAEEKLVPKTKPKKAKLKGYEMIKELVSIVPLNAGDLKDKYREEFGAADDGKIVYNLNYALKLNMVKKQLIGKRYIYGTPDMFEGEDMKEQFLPKKESKEDKNENA